MIESIGYIIFLYGSGFGILTLGVSAAVWVYHTSFDTECDDCEDMADTDDTAYREGYIAGLDAGKQTRLGDIPSANDPT